MLDWSLKEGHFSLLQSQLAKRFTLCLSSLKLRHLTRNLRATTCILYAEYFYALRKNNAQWRSLKIDFTTKFLMAQSTITKFGLKALGTCRFTTQIDEALFYVSVTPQESGRSLINHVNSISYIISVPSWVPYWSSFSSNSRMYYSIREHFKHTLRTTQWPLSGEHVLFSLSMQDYRFITMSRLRGKFFTSAVFVHETSFNSSAGHSENSFM